MATDLFERPSAGERALLVHPVFGRPVDPLRLQEFRELAVSAGAEIVDQTAHTRHKPEPKFLIGSGKANELAEWVAREEIELLLFDATLSPSQERNLEKLCRCRVLDRTGLILDIFAQRARSHEGKLQVELAQLRYISTRLVRGWTHLERQKGGIGLRGPGETQLETDRRLLAQRIKQIEKRLAKVRSQRKQSRSARKKNTTPTVALVGYTNAGKSTLFNRLTHASVYQADQLFATLDPTLRRLTLKPGLDIILADTVGFIRELPHDLVAAFHSTLEETLEADLLLHVVDAGAEDRDENIEEVQAVLEQLGAQDQTQLFVYNKIDLLALPPQVDVNADGSIQRVWLSAQTGAGIDLLLTALGQWFQPKTVHVSLHIPLAETRLRASLYNLGAIINESCLEDGSWLIEARLPQRDFKPYKKYLIPPAEHDRSSSQS